ncbi:hypothetical protein, partial [Porcipelethomonas sp.]|uniref:hypothetical protein n=1 Tax=Porcipelethomonas sp. TaxID=2981675 RepID=UPI003EF1C773
TTAQEGINLLLITLQENFPAIISSGISIIESLISGIADNSYRIVMTIKDLLLELISEISVNLPSIIDSGVEIVESLLEGIDRMIPDLMTSAVEIVTTICEKVVEHGPDLIDAAIEIILDFAAGILENLDSLLPAVIDLMQFLSTGMIDHIPTVLEAIPKLTEALCSAIFDTDWLEIGMQIIEGIGKGLVDGVASIGGYISEAASGIKDGITNFFGIKSPSRLMRDLVGKNLALGIGVGFADEIPEVTDDAVHALHGLTSAAAESADITGGTTENNYNNSVANDNSRTTVSNTYNIYTQASKASDAAELAVELENIKRSDDRGVGRQMLYFIFRGIKSTDMGIKILSIPLPASGKRSYDEINIPGRAEPLFSLRDDFSSVTKSITFEFQKGCDIYALLSWLAGSGDLIISDYPDKFYKAISCSPVAASRINGLYRNMTVSFVCSPFSYSVNNKPIQPTCIPGETFYAVDENVGGNIYCLPKFKFTLSSNAEQVRICTLQNGTENSRLFIFNVLPAITYCVDAERQKVYKENSDGSLEIILNQTVGDLPVLYPGINTITYQSDGADFSEFSIVKNERWFG